MKGAGDEEKRTNTEKNEACAWAGPEFVLWGPRKGYRGKRDGEENTSPLMMGKKTT